MVTPRLPNKDIPHFYEEEQAPWRPFQVCFDYIDQELNQYPHVI